MFGYSSYIYLKYNEIAHPQEELKSNAAKISEGVMAMLWIMACPQGANRLNNVIKE